jgi:cytochrome oxidase assembly protein ShyY1
MKRMQRRNTGDESKAAASVLAMYGFARQPKWIAAHFLALLLMTTFIWAGFWQFGRHQDRGQRNETVLSRAGAPMLSEQDLFGTSEDIEFRQAELRGTWSTSDAVYIRNRSHQQAPGCHLAVPLATNELQGVLVVIGWIHETECQATIQAAPAGVVSLTGRVRLSQTRGAIGARDRSTGVLRTLARTDVARVDQQVNLALAPVYVEMIQSTPEIGRALPVDRPPTDIGPHLGYSVQWFLFFGVGAVGYPLVLRRQARRGEAENLEEIAD